MFEHTMKHTISMSPSTNKKTWCLRGTTSLPKGGIHKSASGRQSTPGFDSDVMT